MKNVDKYEAYIFDVDGTLYSQKKMHIRMAIELVKYYLCHPFHISDIFIIMLFRKYREKKEYKLTSMEELYDIIAEKRGYSKERIRHIIAKWMFIVPLEIMKKCKYLNVICFINEQESNGKKIFIYSDYPADGKIMALEIKATGVINSEDEPTHELKPSRKVMEHLMQLINCRKENILYVGDREEKDGQSAHMAGIDYCDIKMFRKMLI